MVSCTSTRRGPRARVGPTRRDGTLEHRFVSDTAFTDLEAAGFFLGTVALPGLPYRYALPKVTLRDDGPIDTIMARAPFIDLFAPYFPDRLVYEIEDTLDRARGGSSPGGATSTRSTRASRGTSPRSRRAAGSRRAASSTTEPSTALVEAIAAAVSVDVLPMSTSGARSDA